MTEEATVAILDDPKKIEASFERTRKQILTLLSDKEMTLTQISKRLGLSKRSISHHLQILLERELISLTSMRINEYGIQEKFYRAKALVLLGDFNKSSRRVKEETLESNRDIVIGYLCARPKAKISDKKLDELAYSFTLMVQKVSREHAKVRNTRTQTKLAIYKEAFKRLEKDKEWQSIEQS